MEVRFYAQCSNCPMVYHTNDENSKLCPECEKKMKEFENVRYLLQSIDKRDNDVKKLLEKLTNDIDFIKWILVVWLAVIAGTLVAMAANNG